MTQFTQNSSEGLYSTLNLERARAWALEAGFTEAGLVALPYADENRDAERFEAWVGAGHAGTMQYLERRSEDGELLRARVATPFPWARSAVVCFAGYQSGDQLSVEAADAGAGWIARYAWSSRTDQEGRRRPSDYHKVLKKRLERLEERIRKEIGVGVNDLHSPVPESEGSPPHGGRPLRGDPGPGAPTPGAPGQLSRHGAFEARGYVDTGPVVERSLATAAGLGWTGKNTCLIHPKLGSFGFLAVLLTSLEVDEVANQRVSGLAGLVPDRCGSCRRCIEACPTNALTEPYKMDATRCISYLTIEHKGTIADELMEGMGRQVFGCDICQDVCPWNSPRRTPIAADAEMEPRAELVNPALEWLAAMDEAEFERQFNGSPVRRAGFKGMRRNVAIAMGNSGQARFRQWLEACAQDTDEGVRSAARWAMAKLKRD